MSKGAFISKKLGFRRFSRSVSAVSTMFALTASALAVPAIASASTNSNSCRSANGIKITNATICKGLAFYKGRTLNFIEPGSVGAGFDLQAQAEIPALEAYLGATVDEIRYTTGLSFTGQDATAAAAPNGLTIGLLNPITDATTVIENQPGLNFNPAREAYLSGSAADDDILVSISTSGITTFSQFLGDSKSGKVRILTSASGLLPTIFRSLMAAAGGISINSPDWLTGYGNQADVTAGLLRGDGPTAFVPLTSSNCQLLESDKLVALVTGAVPPVGTDCRKYLTSIPTIVSLARTYGKTKAEKTLWKTTETLYDMSGFPTITQTKVAGYKVDALRAALKWVYEQASFKTTMLADGLNPVFENPIEAKQLYQKSLTLGKTVVCYLSSGDVCSRP